MAEETLDLEAFAHVVAHDLGAPIRGLSIHLRLLERDMQNNDQEGAIERMGLLQGRLRRMDEMLRRIRHFSKVHVAGGNESSDIHVLVWEALEHVETGDAHVTVTGTATVQAPGLLVLTMLQELLRNAIEHHDGTPEVTVLIDDTGVTITDDGPGLPDEPETMMALFGPTGNHIEEGGGSGLALTRYIARHLGGDLELVSPVRDGRGVEARLRFRD